MKALPCMLAILSACITAQSEEEGRFRYEYPGYDNTPFIASKGKLTAKTAYDDCQLHLEWWAPDQPTGNPGNMGNSGIFFMSLYELQIYDSFSAGLGAMASQVFASEAKSVPGPANKPNATVSHEAKKAARTLSREVVQAHIDVSRPVGPYHPVHDMITPWNSRSHPMPFEPGSAYDRRFHQAGFRMCRLVAFSDSWLWGAKVTRGEDGDIAVDFTDFDRMLDLAIAAHCEPYVRLAYNVPAALSSAPAGASSEEVAYSRPTNVDEWDQLMADLVRHCNLTRKLGIRYFVASLNEAENPARKGHGSWDQALELYARTVKAARAVDPSIKVGGPATIRDPRGDGGTYMRRFLRYCAEHQLPLDFICFHGYRRAPREYEQMLLAIKKMVQEEYPGLRPEPEYFIDEFGQWSKTARDDNEYGAAYLIASHHFLRRGGITKVGAVSFNHFKEWDEGFVYNDATIRRYIGLPLLKGPVVTAPYFALQMQSVLQGQALAVQLNGTGGITQDEAAGITATIDGKSIAIQTWTFDPEFAETHSSATRDFRIQLSGFRPGEQRHLRQYVLDHDHTNPYTDYVINKKDTNDGQFNLEQGVREKVTDKLIRADPQGNVTLELRLQPFAISLSQLD